MHVFERHHVSTLVQCLTRGREVFPSVIFIEGPSPQRECANTQTLHTRKIQSYAWPHGYLLKTRWQNRKAHNILLFVQWLIKTVTQWNALRNANVCRPLIINLSKSVSSYTWTYARMHMLVISLMLVIMDDKFHQKQRAIPRMGSTHLRQSHVVV